MATLTSSVITIQIAGGETVVQGNVTSTPSFTDTSASARKPFVNGTSVSEAQGTLSFNYTASTSGGAIDLTSIYPSLSGSTAIFSAIKAIKIENLDSANTVTIQTSTSFTNTWQGISGNTNISKAIQPGGCFGECEPVGGMPVTMTNKTIYMVASAGSPVVKVSLVGNGSNL